MRRTPATALAAALLAAGLALAGCGSTAGDGAGADSAEQGAAAREDAGGEKAAQQGATEAGARDGAAEKSRSDGRPGGDRTLALADRHVVRTATLTVVTDDVSGRLDEARTAAVQAGGYAGDEKTDQDSGGNERSRITLRVPPDEYDGVLEELAGLGELEERKVSTEDVTDQVVDVESRIKTQQASVARVRKLMDQADELSDIVTLESELSTRQAELEALQARQASLKERTGMATVTLVLREPDGEAQPDSDDDPSFGDALAGGWDAFVTTLRWIAVVLGAVLPFTAALGLLFLLWRTVRERLPQRLRPSLGSFGSGGPVPAPQPVTVPAPLGDRADADTKEGGNPETDRPED